MVHEEVGILGAILVLIIWRKVLVVKSEVVVGGVEVDDFSNMFWLQTYWAVLLE